MAVYSKGSCVHGNGNRNFGATYALAGNVIAAKCHVPVLYRFELEGTVNDVCCQRGAVRVRSLEKGY